MKNNITKKVLDTLGEMKKSDSEAFRTFNREFGRVLKEGIHYDFTRKETIADLLLFTTTKSGEADMRSLADYTADMREGQADIYYMTGTSVRDIADSPYLEAFKEKAYEVLFMTDDIDDLIFSGFEYKGRKLKSVLKGDITLERSGEKSKGGEQLDKLMDFMKTILKDDIKDVRLSGRLKDSPCCLVGDEGDLDPRMEKMLKAMGQETPVLKKVLEINAEHPLFLSMTELFERNGADPLLEEYSWLLLDQALLLSGSRPKDPARFSRYLSHLMVEGAKHIRSAERPDRA
jgi:molecular chaperone HtpG